MLQRLFILIVRLPGLAGWLRGMIGIALVFAFVAASAADVCRADGLYISEVAANHRARPGPLRAKGWVELFNASDKAIGLAGYRLRAWGLDRKGKPSPEPVVFDLPKASVPAGGYYVLAGKLFDGLKGTGKSTYITDDKGQYFPYWSDTAGFVELLSATNGSTVDFVRFGTETTAPMTAAKWTGANVTAFLSVVGYSPSASLDPIDNYDHSIVRLSAGFKTTGTKADWTHVPFPTPGGPNDVPESAVDADKDGIPNTAKVAGGTFAGLDLFAMGARPGQRDLFIRIDRLKSTDAGLIPQREALAKVVQAFEGHKISIHFDVGNLFGANFDPAAYNLSGNISFESPFIKCTQLPRGAADPQIGCSSLYEYTSSVFDVTRRPVFRYALLASSQLASGKQGSSGKSELPGNKFLVALGQWHLSTDGIHAKNVLVNFQASTIMHELGHTLGLHHGGFEDSNYKPNYFSIMNYLYQLRGLPADPAGTGPTLRYYYTMNNKFETAVPGHGTAGSFHLCDISDGPCVETMRMDYSDGSGKSLDEAALDESLNVGRGAEAGAFGDWNLSASSDATAYSRILTHDNIAPHVLRDHDDWSALNLVGGRSYAATLQTRQHPAPECRTASRDPASRTRCWSQPRSATIVSEPTPSRSLLTHLERMQQQRQ